MLVLSRKLGEKIAIGENITITVVEAGYNQVRLGVDAPKEVPVHRQEVYEAIHAGTCPASSGSTRKRHHRRRPSRKS